MAFWIREATLVIGNKKYTLGELDFKLASRLMTAMSRRWRR